MSKPNRSKQSRNNNTKSELRTGVKPQSTKGASKPKSPRGESMDGYNVQDMPTKFDKKQALKNKRMFDNVGKKEASASNDPGWYIYNDQIAKDGDTAMYINRVGLNAHTAMLNGGETHFMIPSLMTFKFCPTPGPTHDGNGAPVNQQTIAMHRRIQRMISKNISSEFTPGDLAQFLICMDSVIMAYAWAQRVYLLNTYYSAVNPTVPNCIWSALNLSPTDMENNINWEGYRTQLNIIGDRLKNISVPTGLKIIARHTWLVSNVFKDSDSDKASLYMFTPSRYYEYHNNTQGTPGGAIAVLKPWPSFTSPNAWGHTNLQAILDFISNLIDRFINDIDIQTMQGRLRTAFDPDQFMTVGYITAGDAMEPVFVPEVLPQIHNMDIVGSLASVGPNTGNVDQTANDGVNQVLLLRGWNNGGYSGMYGKVLDMPFDNPSMEHNYVATRFMVTAQSTTVDDTKVTRLVHYGSEVVEDAFLYYGMGPSYEQVISNYGIEGGNDLTYVGAGPRILLHFCRRAHFNMAPLLKLTNDNNAFSTGEQTQTPTWCDVLGDITNIATMSDVNLGAYHVAALMGEWLNPNLFV